MINFISTNRLFYFISLFVVIFLIFALRRPELINNPYFWAEDGAVWYSQAYNIGPIHSLILPQSGYYQTISKLVASASLAVPLYAAPLFFNVIAICIRTFVVLYLLSSRMKDFPIIGRFIVATYMVLMPNISEVHANVTNTHWYLSLWLFMVIVSEKPTGLYWKVHDYIVLLVAGLSGPFIVFMAPAVALRLVRDDFNLNPVTFFRTALSRIDAFTVAFCAVCFIQVLTIIVSSGVRSHAPLGASLELAITIASSKIFAGFILPSDIINILWDSLTLNIIFSVFGMAVLAFLILTGSWKERSIVIFPVLMICFALAKPNISHGDVQWPYIQFGSGERYFLITNVMWCAILLIAAKKFGKVFSKLIPATIFALILFVGIFNFSLPQIGINGWSESMSKFDSTKHGEEIKIPIRPQGWFIDIIKK